MNFNKSFIFFLVFILYFTASTSKVKEMKCEDITFSEGFYVLKYTFVKYTGLCFLFNADNEIKEQRSFLRGEKSGMFRTFKNKKIIENYNMKRNQFHGFYELYKDNNLYKKILYNDGEVENCEVDFNFIIDQEKKLNILKEQSLKFNKINNNLDVMISNLTDNLTKDKESCSFFD